MDFNSIFQAISTGGAVAVLVWLVWSLINEKLVPMGRLEDQKALTKEALDGWKQANNANERLADAWEARNAAETKFQSSLRENK